MSEILDKKTLSVLERVPILDMLESRIDSEINENALKIAKNMIEDINGHLEKNKYTTYLAEEVYKYRHPNTPIDSEQSKTTIQILNNYIENKRFSTHQKISPTFKTLYGGLALMNELEIKIVENTRFSDNKIIQREILNLERLKRNDEEQAESITKMYKHLLE